jgi:hypothetical protein
VLLVNCNDVGRVTLARLEASLGDGRRSEDMQEASLRSEEIEAIVSMRSIEEQRQEGRTDFEGEDHLSLRASQDGS